MAKPPYVQAEKKYTSFIDVPIFSPYLGLFLDPGLADVPAGGWPVHNHFHYYKERIMPYPGWRKIPMGNVIPPAAIYAFQTQASQVQAPWVTAGTGVITLG